MQNRSSQPPLKRRRTAKARGALARAALYRKPLSAAVSAIIASATAPVVMAQNDQSGIEEIMVTATRREQSIQDIPLNIASFDGDMLNAREIGDLAELGRNVPGMYVVDQGKRTSNQIVVRGLNLDTISSAEGIGNSGGDTVSTYVGDIPLYVDLALNDMQRVEVLLGPQGTLYGAGTLGGAIRYLPRRPELGQTTMDFRATGFALAESDGYGNRRGLTANVPFGEKLAFRGSVDYYDDPGFIDTPYLVRDPGLSDPEPDFTDPAAVAANLYSVKDANKEHTLSGRAGLRWQPTDNVDANLTYYYQDMDVGGRTQNNVLAFGTGRYESSTRYPEPNNRKNQLLALEITADLGFAELTSATGSSRYTELGQRDQTDLLITLEYSYEAYPFFSAFTREDQTDKTFNQEVRLVSKGDSRFNWIAGFFYNNQTSDGTSREFTPHYDEYLYQFFGVSLRPDSLEYISVLNSDLTEKAEFGEVGFQVTDRWQISVGGRHYDYTYTTESDATTPLWLTATGDIGPNDVLLNLATNSQDDNGFLYKINTSFQFKPDVMGYLTISEGYRIGAANGVAPCPDPLPPNQIVCALPDEFQYFPDKTTNYEIGMHSQWLDRRLTVNASLFYVDWKDPQLTSATANGAQPIIKNGKGASTQGFELSLDARATDRLRIGMSFAYTDAKLTDDAPNLLRVFTPTPTSPFGPGAGYDGLPAAYVAGQTGDRLPGSPKTQGTFNLGYYFPLNGKWSLDFDYGLTHIGDIITKVGNRADGETLPGYTVHFASATLENGPWMVGFYAQNLTNEYAVTGVRSIRTFVQTVADENGDPVHVRSYANEMLRPREVGLKFSYALKL